MTLARRRYERRRQQKPVVKPSMADLQALKDIASGRQTQREVLRQCDEAVEAERQLDERIRQSANENDNDNEKEV